MFIRLYIFDVRPPINPRSLQSNGNVLANIVKCACISIATETVGIGILENGFFFCDGDEVHCTSI